MYNPKVIKQQTFSTDPSAILSRKDTSFQRNSAISWNGHSWKIKENNYLSVCALEKKKIIFLCVCLCV